MKESNIYSIIKKLVDTNGNKKAAAVKLGYTVRHVNRLITIYKQKGKAGFIHGNAGRKPSTAFPVEIKDEIVNLYINDFSDTNLTHFSEILLRTKGISVSDSTLNKWLREKHIVSPKARHMTVSNERKLLKREISNSSSTKEANSLKAQLIKLDDYQAHPRRPRCKYMGEMIQMDACEKVWIDGQPKWHLHLAVDDATGMVVGAYFDLQETLNGYYNVFYQILSDYGIPAMFYTDRRTVFEYKQKNRLLDDNDTFTQFSYACHTLGVEIKTTSVPQAKGRIERLNGTFEDRLPVELRLAHISNIDEANIFLNSYLKEYNKQFALQFNNSLSVFETQPSKAVINHTLAVISTRKIDGGHTFKFQNKNYYIVNCVDEKQYFIKGTECMIIHCFDGSYYVNVEDKLYFMKEVPTHELYSNSFDIMPSQVKTKQKYIPPMDHPWRKDSWKLFYSSTKKHLYGVSS